MFLDEFDIARKKRPAKIKVLHINDDKAESATPGFIGILNQPKRTDDGTSCRITYSFLIHRDQLSSIENLSDLGLGLYGAGAKNTDEDIYNYIAVCKFDNLSASDFLASSSIVVDWELIIANSNTK